MHVVCVCAYLHTPEEREGEKDDNEQKGEEGQDVETHTGVRTKLNVHLTLWIQEKKKEAKSQLSPTPRHF